MHLLEATNRWDYSCMAASLTELMGWKAVPTAIRANQSASLRPGKEKWG